MNNNSKSKSKLRWFHFWDMSSGGGQKLAWKHIFIQARNEDAAVNKFKRLFDRDPHNVTCSCCGPDYSISDDDTLENLTAYHRNCKWVASSVDEDGVVTDQGHYAEEPRGEGYGPHLTLAAFLAQLDVKAVFARGAWIAPIKKLYFSADLPIILV